MPKQNSSKAKLSNLFFLTGQFIAAYPKLWKARLKYQKDYLELLKSEIINKKHYQVNIIELENLRLLLVIVKDKMRIYHIIMIAIIVFIFLLYSFNRVSTTNITADLYVSAVRMTVADQFKSQGSGNHLNGKLNVNESTIVGVEPRASDFVFIPKNGTGIDLSQIIFPAQTRLDIGQPLYHTLNIEACSTDSLNQSEGQLSVYVKSAKLIGQGIDSTITNSLLTFSRKLNQQTFIVNLDQVDKFQLKNIKATDLIFRDYTANQNNAISTILKGVIKLKDIKDSLELDEGDFLILHFTDTVQVKLDIEKDGLHLKLAGEVNKLNAGVYKKNIEDKKVIAEANKLPKRIYTFTSALFLSILGTVITVLLPIIVRQRRQV